MLSLALFFRNQKKQHDLQKVLTQREIKDMNLLTLIFILLLSTLHAESPRDSALKLARNFQATHSAKSLKWDWAPAVYLYGATKYPELKTYLSDYHKRWINRVPAINRSDRCPPALSALHLAQTGQLEEAWSSMEKVGHYLRFEPRNRLGTIDHLGHSWFSWFYPSSIWVDSLMMYAVLATQWGAAINDESMIEFGSGQPLLFASVLQDQESGAFWHAYNFRNGRTIPYGKSFWLRGNGWVVTSIAEILEVLKDKDKFAGRRRELTKVLVKLSEGLLKFQKTNGAWETVLNRPGYSYDETSGSLLIGYGLAKAYRLGFLPHKYLVSARKAFAYAQTQLSPTRHGVTLRSVSGPTNPGPGWYYKAVRKKKDLPYGVGAFLLLAHELHLIDSEE
ncbi:MAG TPA: glycoside hydrolase family 88 protein [Bacteriovoracaceae bacterium]|nr:glycoside hydrolase family 88 protein [Bacteriovoracaceae bacterium]